MRTVVRKWGNSASVRIPATVMQAAHLDLDEVVDIREESGRIVIEPAQRKEYDLAELVKQITGENLHDEADFGRPVGKETM
jgi:antitoxin MazE